MKLDKTATTTTTTTTTTRTSSSAWSVAKGPFVLLVLQLLAVRTNGNVLSNRVVPICDSGCHCFGSEGDCPAYPTITDDMLPTFRELTHENPMSVRCDPFQSSTCVSSLEIGEACVVDLIPPTAAEAATCPSGYSYRLRTVPSLDDAIASGQYITHTGACGACSSLEDLAIMIEYPSIPYKAQQCFFRSTALKYIDTAITCYQEVGFTESCSAALAYHQRSIVSKNCGYQCAAWGYDGDLGQPSCNDVSGCGACVDGLGITARLELVAGRTFANSGYPSQKAKQCADITPVDVIGGSDICGEAPLQLAPTEVPKVTTPPTSAPVVVPQTAAPVQLATAAPTAAPLPLPTEVPTGNPTARPVEATAPPVTLITASPTPDPIPADLPTTSLTYQQCISTAAIEVRIGAQAGGSGVVCDCSEAETGATNKPRCFSSASRDDGSQCSILYGSCSTGGDCCSSGIRSCRSGLCRPSGQRGDRSSFRLSGNRGGASRNDRSAYNYSKNKDKGDRRLRGPTEVLR